MAVKKYGPFERYVEVPHEWGVTGVPVGKVLMVDTSGHAERGYWLADAEEAPTAQPATEHPILVGGGWYELSDGTRVQGAETARIAQEALDGK